MREIALNPVPCAVSCTVACGCSRRCQSCLSCILQKLIRIGYKVDWLYLYISLCCRCAPALFSSFMGPAPTQRQLIVEYDVYCDLRDLCKVWSIFGITDRLFLCWNRCDVVALKHGGLVWWHASRQCLCWGVGFLWHGSLLLNSGLLRKRWRLWLIIFLSYVCDGISETSEGIMVYVTWQIVQCFMLLWQNGICAINFLLHYHQL